MLFSHTNTTGNRHAAARLTASWKAPMLVVPSPKKHTDTWPVPLSCAAQAAPAAIGRCAPTMAYEPMAPLVTSVRCIEPPLPPQMPMLRPAISPMSAPMGALRSRVWLCPRYVQKVMSSDRIAAAYPAATASWPQPRARREGEPVGVGKGPHPDVDPPRRSSARVAHRRDPDRSRAWYQPGTGARGIARPGEPRIHRDEAISRVVGAQAEQGRADRGDRGSRRPRGTGGAGPPPRRRTARCIADLTRLLAEMRAAGDRGDAHEHALKNTQFHERVVEAAGNRTLLRLWSML